MAFPPLSVNQQRDDDTVTLVLDGEIDMATAPQLDAALTEASGLPALRRLVLDLSEVGFLDSAGLQVVLNAARRVRADGREYRVVSPAGTVPRRLIDLTGLADALGLDEPR